MQNRVYRYADLGKIHIYDNGVAYSKTQNIIVGHANPDGDRLVTINDTIYRVDYLVYTFFIGHIDNPKSIIEHIDGDKDNCDYTNLRLGGISSGTRRNIISKEFLNQVEYKTSNQNPADIYHTRDFKFLLVNGQNVRSMTRKEILEFLGINYAQFDKLLATGDSIHIPGQGGFRITDNYVDLWEMLE